jgi:hypothetical protein
MDSQFGHFEKKNLQEIAWFILGGGGVVLLKLILLNIQNPKFKDDIGKFSCQRVILDLMAHSYECKQWDLTEFHITMLM